MLVVLGILYSNNKKSESKSNIWSDIVTDVVFVEIGAVIQDKYGLIGDIKIQWPSHQYSRQFM